MDNRASAVTAEIPRDPFYMTAGRRLARRLTEISSIRNGLRIVARAGALPAAVWQRLPIDGVFDVTLSERASIQYRAIPQDLIARALYWKGVEAWESATIRTFRKVVRTAESFLDIGANSGFYTLLAAAERPNIRCDAFEPVPRIYKRLCEHIELNGFANRCRAHNVALSDSVGTAQFHVPFEEFPSSSSLNVSGFRGIPGQLIDVPVMSVDHMMDGKKIDLIKLDVEGFEDRVLLGMPKVLAQSRPVMIVECVPDGPYRHVAEILLPLKYKFFHIRQNALIPQPTIVPDFHDVNYLCVPEERAAWSL